MCDGWEAVIPWVYLVKINLIPAITSTVARQRITNGESMMNDE